MQGLFIFSTSLCSFQMVKLCVPPQIVDRNVIMTAMEHSSLLIIGAIMPSDSETEVKAFQ